jgi:hypothetical protein
MRRTGWPQRSAAILVAVGTLTGCYEWTACPGDTRSALRSAADDRRIRIVRADSAIEEIARPRIVGNTLVALEVGRARDGQVRRIPLDSIAAVHGRTYDGPATLKAVLGFGTGLIVGLIAAFFVLAVSLHGLGD